MVDRSPGRILIVRLGALGDIVHAIPVAAALRRRFPSARIDWLVSAAHREIVDLVTVVDRRIAVSDRSPSTRGRERRRAEPPAEGAPVDARLGPLSLLQAVGELRRSRYDVAIDLQGLLKSAALTRASGASRVVGFDSTYLREAMARWLYTDVFDPGSKGLYDPNETRHVVTMNLALLTPLGIVAGAPEFPLAPVDSAAARDLRERTAGRYALLNPGAAWPNKRWPPARLGAVAAHLRERHALMSGVLWGPGEEALAREVVAASDGAAVLTPPTTVADLVALMRGASVLVSGDTGPTHIGAAVGTPIVGLYGPTRPQRNGPWAPGDITISRDVVCQCHHLRRCRRATMCIEDIEVEEVAQAVDRRLAAAGRHGDR